MIWPGWKGKSRAGPAGETLVENWGIDPTGSDQLFGIIRSVANPLLAPGTPPGWGMAGSDEQTDYHVWASPQAFTGTGGLIAHSTFREGGGIPVIYDAETDYSFDVVTIPDQVT
jgi:hypothetical protein